MKSTIPDINLNSPSASVKLQKHMERLEQDLAECKRLLKLAHNRKDLVDRDHRATRLRFDC